MEGIFFLNEIFYIFPNILFYSYDWLAIFNGNSQSPTMTLSGSDSANLQTIYSETSAMGIIFSSDASLPDAGFKIQYQFRE